MLSRYQPLSENLLGEVRGRFGMGVGPGQAGGLQRSAGGGSHSSLPHADPTSQHQMTANVSSVSSSTPQHSTVETVASAAPTVPNVTLPVNSQTMGGVPGTSTSSATSLPPMGGAVTGATPTSVSSSVDTSSQKAVVRQVKLTPLAKPPGLDPVLLMREREAR